MSFRQNCPRTVTAAGPPPDELPFLGGQAQSDHQLSNLRHPGTSPQSFPLSPITSPNTLYSAASSSSTFSRSPEFRDVQWGRTQLSSAKFATSPTLAIVESETPGADIRSSADAAGHLRSPMQNLGRLSICSASTSSSGQSSLASQTYSSASPESSTSSPPAFQTPVPITDLMVPKIEQTEGNDILMSTPPLPVAGPVAGEPAKRARGRPRKHPIPIAKPSLKVTKGRSKTGCATCRRRKKKCDEAKPECNNCVKNSVYCEGYPQKTHWVPGRKGDPRDGTLCLSIPASLPPLVDGVKTQTDYLLLQHFTNKVSRILTLNDDENNPFHDYLLPLAMQHEALMHSLLALSSSHLSNVYVASNEYDAVQAFHIGEAMKLLRENITRNIATDDNDLATSLVLCLDSICRGNIKGSYKPHLNAAKVMLKQQDARNVDHPLRKFLYEFFKYHEVINSITILNDETDHGLYESEDMNAIISTQPTMLGVFDGLFTQMSRITTFRSKIRTRKKNNHQPAVCGKILNEAVQIDLELRNWVCPQELHSPGWFASQLYRQCIWIYLFRTVQSTHDDIKIRESVNAGLEYLRYLPEDSGTQSNLLMPLFMLGCAAFDPAQRPQITERFESLHNWSGLGNVRIAQKVVQKVWQLMDAGETELSWDWERIIRNMGYDFLIT